MSKNGMVSVPRDLIDLAVTHLPNDSAAWLELHQVLAQSADQPQGEPVACAHEWTDDGSFLLVCTACGAQEDHDPKWRDMATAPRDGTLVRLLVEFTEHATEDSDAMPSPTIGANSFDHTGEDAWQFAGWSWEQDCFTQGAGEPVGWLPLLDTPHVDPIEIKRLRQFQAAYMEWSDKTDWVQQTAAPRELGMHRADAIKQRFDTLSAKLAERDALWSRVIDHLEFWKDHPYAECLQGIAADYRKLSASAEPSASAVSIPDGYCLMPRRLTAENGAKALLLGEFKLEVTRECPECVDLEEPAEGCEVCDGEGEYTQRHTIPWDKIKFIYSEAVKGLALQPHAAQARK